MRLRRLLTPLLIAGLATGCSTPAPTPGQTSGPVPDLRGARVMLFPVQSLQGVDATMDAELAFALAQRGAEVEWVERAELDRARTMSPAVDVRVEGLPVGVFLQGEVRRIGDPLFGYLFRLGALVDSEVALIPVQARYRPATELEPSAVEVAAAVLSVRTGQVLWFGIVEGEPGAANDPRVLATAAEAFGRRILPLGGSGPR